VRGCLRAASDANGKLVALGEYLAARWQREREEAGCDTKQNVSD
jgi:hypothetical protein